MRASPASSTLEAPSTPRELADLLSYKSHTTVLKHIRNRRTRAIKLSSKAIRIPAEEGPGCFGKGSKITMPRSASHSNSGAKGANIPILPSSPSLASPVVRGGHDRTRVSGHSAESYLLGVSWRGHVRGAKMIAIVDWHHGRVILHEADRMVSMDLATFQAYLEGRMQHAEGQASQAGAEEKVIT